MVRERAALIEAFRDVYGAGGPVTCFAAPGRVNLLGGHTDYNDGFVLPVAIDRRVAVAGRPRSDDTVRVHSTAYEGTHSASIDALDSADGRWSDYAYGVIARLARDHEIRGCDVLVDGDLPQGAGLSSSAALEMAVAALVDAQNDLGLSRRTLAHRCWRAENEFVGVNCGIMDQYATALGEADGALFLDCRSRDVEHVPLPSGTVKPVVVNTNVSHELVDSEYNARREQCEAGVERLDRHLDREVESLRDVSPADLDAHGDRLPETVGRRCRHVVEENRRVRRAATALKDGDLPALGRYMFESHASLRDLYEVSCPELDVVVDLARERDGVLGARMTGAGFGGSVVALVRTDDLPAATDAISRGYRSETGIEPDVRVCSAVDGCRRLDTET